jgi:hypothetical protein
MRGIDKATGRVIALIVLLVLTAASLRGYVPAAQRVSHQQETGSPATLAVIAVLLAASLVIVAFSFIHRMRNPRATASSVGALPASLAKSGSDKARPSWRVVLIGLAVLSAWLFVLLLVMKLTGQHSLDQLEPPNGAHTDVPSTDPTTTSSPPTDTEPRPDRSQRKPGGDVVGYLAVTAAGMLLVIAAGVVATGRTRRQVQKVAGSVDQQHRPASTNAGPQSLARATELGLAEMGDLSREPRDAIIGCYVTMERELARVPDVAPQDFDTPTEVLDRAVEHHALPADNAAQLVNLFAEARFSRHQMTEGNREDAVRILRLVLAELRSPA